MTSNKINLLSSYSDVNDDYNNKSINNNKSNNNKINLLSSYSDVNDDYNNSSINNSNINRSINNNSYSNKLDNNNNSISLNNKESDNKTSLSKKRKEYDQVDLIKIILPISKRCLYSDYSDSNSDNNNNISNNNNNSNDNNNNNNSDNNNSNKNNNKNSDNKNNNNIDNSNNNINSKSSQHSEKKRKIIEYSSNSEFNCQEPTSKKLNSNSDNSTDSNNNNNNTQQQQQQQEKELLQQLQQQQKELIEQLQKKQKELQQQLQDQLNKRKDELYEEVKHQLDEQLKQVYNFYFSNKELLKNIRESHQFPQESDFKDQFKGVTILEKIGGGGFGTVYDGTYHGIPVAVKIQYVDRSFINEANLLTQLYDPSVCRLFGVFHHGPIGCMVLEKMKCSLSKFISDNPTYNSNVTSKIIQGIANGLKYLHNDEDVCHVDLHPGNILMDEDFNIKITDFGLSKIIGSTFRVNGRCAQSYTAPELKNAKYPRESHTKSSDIYQFGLIINRMFRGVDTSIHEALRKSMIEEDPSMRPSIDQVLKMLK